MATIVKRETGEGTRYQVKVRVQGERARSKTFARLTDAKAWAAAVETDLGRGVYVPTTADRRRTVADLIDVTIRDHLPNKRHSRDNAKLETKLIWWKDAIGYVGLDKLKPEVIGEAIADLRKTKTRSGAGVLPATINRYLAALSVACQYAVRTLRWLPDNPVKRIERGAESAGVVRFLSDDERKRLIEAAKADGDPNMHTAIILALATGARVDNLRKLTWADIDFERNAARFEMTKNGQGRWVPLIPAAVDALKAHRERDVERDDLTSYVFKDRRHGIAAMLNTAPWRRIRDAAKLDAGLRFHDLRHSTATYLLAAGANTIEIAAALGHKTLAMAQRYAHQSPDMARSIFDKLAGKL